MKIEKERERQRDNENKEKSKKEEKKKKKAQKIRAEVTIQERDEVATTNKANLKKAIQASLEDHLRREEVLQARAVGALSSTPPSDAMVDEPAQQQALDISVQTGDTDVGVKPHDPCT